MKPQRRIAMNSVKKVGMLTFSYSSNPGSVLQAYVLQQTISSFENYNATIINYQKTSADKPIIGKTVFCRPIKKWTPKKIAAWTIRIIAHPIRMRKYERFFNKYYNYCPQPVKKNDLKELESSYNCFVVGSDQVWNMGSYSVDTTYFLDFVNDSKKKISYAASFGSGEITESNKEEIKALISDFSFISVREKEGVKTVLDLTQKEAKWVLDPSLLWTKEQYHELVKAPRNKNYVFLYLREESPKLEKFAHDLAKRYGLSVIKVLRNWRCNKRGTTMHSVGPQQWLGYMKNADYVVTNSFHGICFSLTFEKEFYVDLLKGVSSYTNARLKNALEQFELADRGIDFINDLNELKKIDYSKVNKIKEERKEYSLNYLKNALDRSSSVYE